MANRIGIDDWQWLAYSSRVMAVQFSNITVDKFGRVVIPKEIRDRIGARPGTEFEIEEQDNVILLKPIQKKAKIIIEKGLPVIELGEPIDVETVNRTLEKIRNERIQSFL